MGRKEGAVDHNQIFRHFGGSMEDNKRSSLGHGIVEFKQVCHAVSMDPREPGDL